MCHSEIVDFERGIEFIRKSEDKKNQAEFCYLREKKL